MTERTIPIFHPSPFSDGKTNFYPLHIIGFHIKQTTPYLCPKSYNSIKLLILHEVGLLLISDKQKLNRYNCVKAIFSGHHHSGAFGYFDHIPCNTVEGMIETPDKNSFGIVRIYKDRIELEGKERMTSRLFMLQP